MQVGGSKIDKTKSNYYLKRVLKPGAIAIIHHANRNNLFLRLGFARHWGEPGKQFYKLLSMGRLRDHDGWRSNISKTTIKELAGLNGLMVIKQFQYWDDNLEFGVPRFNDRVSILTN
jgi:hypothetical protein